MMESNLGKKNSGEFVENANHQFTTGSGTHQVMFHIQDTLFSLPPSFQRVNI